MDSWALGLAVASSLVLLATVRRISVNDRPPSAKVGDMLRLAVVANLAMFYWTVAFNHQEHAWLSFEALRLWSRLIIVLILCLFAVWLIATWPRKPSQ